MEKAFKKIKEIIEDKDFEKCVISNPRLRKQEIQSLIINEVQDKARLQIEIRYLKHNNIISLHKTDFIQVELKKYLNLFKQFHLKAKTLEVQILLNKKMVSKIIENKMNIKEKKITHNKVKNYLIPEGIPCSFLEHIGVMDEKGNVRSQFYKKFKQINRFLELVDDLYDEHTKDVLRIIDFGCGKSYLTFALYHYFVFIKQQKVNITGIDLKEEVIKNCNQIAKDLKFTGLNFVKSFIQDFRNEEEVDLVVTLHACDTATDDAILFALKNKADKMMFVPCCQHELNSSLQNQDSYAMLKHGILKDRICAIITDSMRASLLEICGYKVQIMEFIDLEHTAKNIVLRCKRVKRKSVQVLEKRESYLKLKKEWNIEPYLEKMLLTEKICESFTN